MNSILSVVLGAVLALATSFLFERYKDNETEKKLTLNFKTILRLELKNLLGVIDKLSDNFSDKTYFTFVYIDQLDKNLQRLENIRKDSVYLSEELKKEEVLVCINDLSVYASNMRGIENYAFNKIENETKEDREGRLDFCSRERQMLALKTVDLKRRIQEIINFSQQK